MKNIISYIEKYQWGLMAAGVVIFMMAAAARYYSRTYVQEKSEAVAEQSLQDIEDKAFVMISKVEHAAQRLKREVEHHLDQADLMLVYSRKVLRENKMLKGCSISFEPYYYPEKGRYFSAYSYSGGQEIVTEQEGNDNYQYFCMDWYLIPRQLDRDYWTEPYEETNTDGIIVKEVMTSYSLPIHNATDSLIGVLSVDVPLTWLSDFINAQHPMSQSYCMLIGRGGKYIVHPDQRKLLYETVLTNTLENNDPDLTQLGRAMINGQSGTQILILDGTRSHVFYKPFADTGWSLALVCPDQTLMFNYYILSFLLIVVMTISFMMMLTPLWFRLHSRLTTFVLILSLSVALISCQKNATVSAGQSSRQGQTAQARTDSLIALHEGDDDTHFFAFIDSLETNGVISPENANFQRSDRYQTKNQLRTAIFYLKKALSTGNLMKNERELYYTCVQELCVTYHNSYNVQACLEAATKGYQIASKDTILSARNWAYNYLEKIGDCQLILGHTKEAEHTFKKVMLGASQLSRDNPEDIDCQENTLLIASNIVSQYMVLGIFTDSIISPWLALIEETIGRYAATDVPMKSYERYLGMTYVNEAIVLYMSGRVEEAETEFQKFMRTEYAKTYNGYYDQEYYYTSSGQWDRVLKLRRHLDSTLDEVQTDLTLDDLIQNQVATFTALYKTNHKDEALSQAVKVMSLLDTVLVNSNKNNAAELAVIYETQQKEEQIAQQRATLNQQRIWTFAIILGLITIAFAVIFLLRHRAARHLEVEHEKLLSAYDQLEATTTAKERIESELRIARDIQMSMVPSIFPQRDGLEMYASMAPAREVGGDLYDYLLQGDMLYFCVGDVSGKGVPASLFMAQTIRLFRALAKQHHQPAQIATEMNDELAESNDSGMFVTMFIGLVDLTTGHLKYCNAGHNPPVMGGDRYRGSFLQMEPNAPIGLWENLTYIGEEIASIKGRPLFIYTDGLNEAENDRQEQLGDERVLSILQDTQYRSPQQVIETLTMAVEAHRNHAEPNDDLTMMCINIK